MRNKAAVLIVLHTEGTLGHQCKRACPHPDCSSGLCLQHPHCFSGFMPHLWKWALCKTCLVPLSLCATFRALWGFDLCLHVPFAHWKIFSVAGLALSQFQDLNNKNLGTSWSFSSGLCVPVLGRVDRLYPWLSLHYTVNEMWRACCSQHGNARPPAALSAVFWYLESWVWITDDRIFLLGYVCHSHCTQKYCVCVSHCRIYVRAFSCRIFAFH